MRLVRAFLLLPLAFPCHATSFDCAKAESAVEKVICSNAALSSLDDKLAIAYRTALAKAGEGDIALKLEQRQWLSDTTDNCKAGDIATCVREAYTARIATLVARPAFDPKGLTEFRLTKASKNFDFVIRIRADKPDGMNEYRAGPGRVLVYRKGSKTPLQTLAFDNIFVSFDDDGSPLTNSAALYDDQGVINVGDFNFDGHEDFGVQTGNSSSYGAPSYDIYLFEPSSGQFRFSQSLRELTENSLGFFDIDSKHKRLVTRSKDGCCYHEMNFYTVQDNRPVPVYREIDDANQEPGYSHISKERMVHGQWRSISSKRVRDKDEDAK